MSLSTFISCLVLITLLAAKVAEARNDLFLLISLFSPKIVVKLVSVQFSSIAQSCPTLCDAMDCSMQALPVLHHLPKFAQTHVHSVRDAVQPSHPLSPPFAFSLSRPQGLFQSVGFSHQEAKILKLQLQQQSFQ